ncbi:hypothetical protein SRHO_G00055830, partial [Serrasalmus rhombeus]
MSPKQWRSTNTQRNFQGSCTIQTHSASGSLEKRPNFVRWTSR